MAVTHLCCDVTIKYVIVAATRSCDQGLTAILKAYYVQNAMHFIVNASDREGNSKVYEIWKDYNIKLAIAKLGDVLDRLIVLMRNGVWRKLCYKVLNNFKGFDQQQQIWQ